MKISSLPNEDEAINRGIAYFTVVIGLTLMMLGTLSSCNTTRGFGRDVERVGEHIEHAANRASGN